MVVMPHVSPGTSHLHGKGVDSSGRCNLRCRAVVKEVESSRY